MTDKINEKSSFNVEKKEGREGQECLESALRFECSACSNMFETLSDCALHIKSEHEHVCEFCRKVFQIKHDLLKHQELCNPDAFTCKECDVACFNRSNYTRHVKTKHGAEKISWVCRICGVDFQSQDGLASHINEGCLRFTCQTCGCNSKFSSKSELICHEQNCKGFRCKYCMEQFHTTEGLSSHYDDKHKNVFSAYARSVLIKTPEKQNVTVTRPKATFAPERERDKSKRETFICDPHKEGLKSNHVGILHSVSESLSSSSGQFVVEDAVNDGNSPIKQGKQKRKIVMSKNQISLLGIRPNLGINMKLAKGNDDGHTQKRLKQEEEGRFDCAVGNDLMSRLHKNDNQMKLDQEMDQNQQQAKGDQSTTFHKAVATASKKEIVIQDPFASLIIDILNATRKTIYGNTCDICDGKFSFVQEFVKHRKKTHKDGRPYNCILCFERFLSASLLINHYDQFHFIVHK